MRMGTVALYTDHKVAENHWKYGLNTFEMYISEILAHAGIPFQQVGTKEQLESMIPDVLIIVLEDENPETTQMILNYVRQGGTVISYSRLAALANELGCIQHSFTGESYVHLPSDLSDVIPLRCLKANPWEAAFDTSMDIKQTGDIALHHPKGEQAFKALLRFRIGEGTIERWAVDIPACIVGFQQGSKPILKDGIPAPDGTAKIDDGILKADDSMEMNWIHDRLETETGAAYFAHPYADLWREVCVSHLLKVVVNKGLTLPFIGYWPDGIQSVATISHDSDGNKDEQADSTLNVLMECQVKSTWCMLEPGYSDDMHKRIEQEGHELAFHYNALEKQGGEWGEQAFKRQIEWLKAAVNNEKITTNKNHYTRFEGWGELFLWCEQNGIEVEQSRGPSKGGNVGFLFGTCHPFFPISWSNEQNRLYNVLELSFLAPDMDIGSWSDSSVIDPLLKQVMQVQGAAHFLFHQVHIHTKPILVEAFRKLVSKAREMGFTFWTSKQINDWERARRKLNIIGINEQGHAVLQGEESLEDIVVWVPVDSNQQHSGPLEIRFGVTCMKKVYQIS